MFFRRNQIRLIRFVISLESFKPLPKSTEFGLLFFGHDDLLRDPLKIGHGSTFWNRGATSS